jgi:hypothetical protein
MKNITNTLNKLTKFLAVAIMSVSLNAFSIVPAPHITISINHVRNLTVTVKNNFVNKSKQINARKSTNLKTIAYKFKT